MDAPIIYTEQTILYIDVETTGLDAVKQDVIDIAILVEKDGTIVHKEKLSCRPHHPENAHPKALEINGRTMEQIMGFPDPIDTLYRFKEILINHKTNEKFIFAGFNTSFDARFIKSWMEKCGDNSFGEYFELDEYGKPTQLYDCLLIFKKFSKERGVQILNNKLLTIAEFFEIEHDAHEAMSDILVTHKITKMLEKYYTAVPENCVPNSAAVVVGEIDL